ncbi:MAG: HD domain-containing protein, partial [Nanoarchaeota archaeon]|nr:HD domain-containing protein [Nanoarchaeota archaeon]
MAKTMAKSNKISEVNNFTNFLFELGALKHVKRSGWWLINVKDPENVAEHSFRAAVIGYVLAKMENGSGKSKDSFKGKDNINVSSVDVNKVTMMCLFNDLHEARLNDLHKVGHRYIDFRKAETAAHGEQTENLGDVGEEIFGFHEEFQAQKTKESIIARDADLLENAFQAKEY